MKHIKRKTLLSAKVEIPNNIVNQLTKNKNLERSLRTLQYKDVKDNHAILLLESGELIRAFFVNNNKAACLIPLANPVLVYFNFAQSLLKSISTTKELLLQGFPIDTKVNEDSLKLFYDYFGQVSSFVMMLMTSLESFVNQKLDPSKTYIKQEANKFSKVYDYKQIQRLIPLSEKVTEILDIQQCKSFQKKHPSKHQHLENLKTLRDLIVHTKAEDKPNAYDELFKKALSFNLIDTINSVKDFINFYENDLVEPCPCSIED